MKKNIIILLLAIIFFSCGCTKNNSGKLENNIANDILDNFSENESSELSNKERADIIKVSILEINGINYASVAVTGNSALIGIKVDYTDKEEIDRLKNEAAKVAKEASASIKNTAVTNNNEITKMINDIENNRE